MLFENTPILLVLNVVLFRKLAYPMLCNVVYRSIIRLRNDYAHFSLIVVHIVQFL